MADSGLEQVLDYLGIRDKFPCKISLHDIAAKPTIHKVEAATDAPWYILQKLIGTDYRGRNKAFFPKARDTGSSASSLKQSLRSLAQLKASKVSGSQLAVAVTS